MFLKNTWHLASEQSQRKCGELEDRLLRRAVGGMQCWGEDPTAQEDPKCLQQRCHLGPPSLSLPPGGEHEARDQRRGVQRGCAGKMANMFLQPPRQRAAGTSFRQRCPGQMLISPQPHCLIHYSESKLILFSSEKK